MTHDHFHATVGSTNLNNRHKSELEQTQCGSGNMSCLKNPQKRGFN